MDDHTAKHLENFIVDNPDLERLEDLLAEFNIFEVLEIQASETRHSAFLAWLLTPSGTHGLGDYFLRRFLWLVTSSAAQSRKFNVTPFQVDSWALGDAIVETERHNIDVLVTSNADEFVCAIENKIFSGEHGDQLKRYRQTVLKEFPDFKQLHVFLSPEGISPADPEDAEHYVPISYEEVDGLLRRTIEGRGRTLSTNVLNVLNQYSESLRRHVLVDSDIQHLARQIYLNHREAIDLIVEAKPDLQEEIREVVEETMSAFGLFGQDVSSKGYIRYYDTRWDDIPELCGVSDWTTTKRLLLFEFKNEGQSLRLYLLVGPGPETTRARLWDLAHREDAKVLKPSQKDLPKYHGAIYTKFILSKSDYIAPDIESIRAKVKNTVLSLVNEDLEQMTRDINVALTGKAED